MALRTPIRHGEILLLPIESAPTGTAEKVTECIVGHSETGHHHVLESDAEFRQIVADSGDLYVDLDAPTPLRHRKDHQQHRELSVPAGAWRVIRKTEFDVRMAKDRPERDLPELKRPDERWKTLLARSCPQDVPRSPHRYPSASAERAVFEHAVNTFGRQRLDRLAGASRTWFLRPVVVSAGHWARFSMSIRSAYECGLGWMIPASHDVLIVPRPTLRCTDAGNLHDDAGRRAVEWPDGTGAYFLDGMRFDERLYFEIIGGELTLDRVADLRNADQRSIALRYTRFDKLVAGRARLLDIGVKGTRLYRLVLPSRIAADRPRGYGPFDYFIHMRDASHPEREFVEWVDPIVGRMHDAELCQAQAFGIPLDVWLSVEQEG